MFDTMEASIIKEVIAKWGSLHIVFVDRKEDKEHPMGMSVTLGEGKMAFAEYHKGKPEEFTDAYMLQAVLGCARMLDRVTTSPS